MFAQYAAEEQKESQSVYNATGSDMPSRFPYKKGKCTASYPNGKENVGGYMAVEIEQTPHQEKEWNRIGEQMLEAAVHQWMCENSEHTPLFHRIYSQLCEVPVHAYLQKLQNV
jgi:hypothetical protein